MMMIFIFYVKYYMKKMVYTITKKNNQSKIKINFENDLLFIIYLENIYGLSNIETIISNHKSDILNYISLNYKIKLLNGNVYIKNVNDIKKLEIFFLNKLYLIKLDRLFLNSKTNRYLKVLKEYMFNLTNKKKNYTQVTILDEDKYPTDYFLINDNEPKVTDLKRFMNKNKLFLLTPLIFYDFFIIINIHKEFFEIDSNIFLTVFNNDKLVLFIFDHVKLKIYCIYKNINPKKIFKKYFTKIKIYERIENKLIFEHESKFYSICVYEYFPYITSYFNFKNHIFNYFI